MLGGGAFKKVAIPLLIRAGDEKALPHLRERRPLLGVLCKVSGCAAVMYLFRGHSNICRIQFLRLGEPVNRPCVCRASVFTAGADLLAAEEISL